MGMLKMWEIRKAEVIAHTISLPNYSDGWIIAATVSFVVAGVPATSKAEREEITRRRISFVVFHFGVLFSVFILNNKNKRTSFSFATVWTDCF